MGYKYLSSFDEGAVKAEYGRVKIGYYINVYLMVGVGKLAALVNSKKGTLIEETDIYTYDILLLNMTMVIIASKKM